MFYFRIFLGIALLIATYPLTVILVGSKWNWPTGILWAIVLASWALAIYSFFRFNTGSLPWLVFLAIIANLVLGFFVIDRIFSNMGNNLNSTNPSLGEEFDLPIGESVKMENLTITYVKQTEGKEVKLEANGKTQTILFTNPDSKQFEGYTITQIPKLRQYGAPIMLKVTRP